MSGHDPRLHTKPGRRWLVNDEGQELPAQPLHRFECSCGWGGALWYASAARAWDDFERHVEVES